MSIYLVEELSTAQSDVYEGVHWSAKVIRSNRHGTRVEFTSVGSDAIWRVPESRAESTAERLRVGEDPDRVAQSLPVEF